MRADEVRRFAVVLRGTQAVATGRGDHRQTFEAIVHLGIAREEILSGVRWWRDELAHTAFWRTARSRFARPVEADEVPRGLLERFGGGAVAQVVAMLRFLGPLTSTSGGHAQRGDSEARP